MSNVEIVIQRDEITEALTRTLELMGHLGPAMKLIGDRMLELTDKRFDTQTDPDGKPWADLHPSSWLRKKSQKILTEQGDRGGLRGSINYRSGDDWVSIGTNKPYAAILQLGGHIRAHVIRPKKAKALRFFAVTGAKVFAKEVEHPGSNFPPRPFLGVGDAEIQAIIGILSDFVRVG